MNICCCCLHKVHKSVEIQNEPRDSLPNVNIGKIPNFEQKFSNMNIYCCCFHKVNKFRKYSD